MGLEKIWVQSHLWLQPKQHSHGVCRLPPAPGTPQQLPNSPEPSLCSAKAAVCTCRWGFCPYCCSCKHWGSCGVKQGHFGSGWLDSWGKDHKARQKCETWLHASLPGLLHIPQHIHPVSTPRTLHVLKHLCSLFPLTHNELTFSLLISTWIFLQISPLAFKFFNHTHLFCSWIIHYRPITSC